MLENSPLFVTYSQAEKSKTLEMQANIVFNIRETKLLVDKECPLALFLKVKTVLHSSIGKF